MKRYLFLPSDYRQRVVLGWVGPLGWVPDEPCGRDGVLILVSDAKDTPTAPPPPLDSGPTTE